VNFEIKYIMRFYRVAILVAAFVACTILSAQLAALYITRQLSAKLHRDVARLNDIREMNAEKTAEIDFYSATGISRPELESFLEQRIDDEQRGLPVMVTLQNGQGDYLVDNRVIVKWDDGEYRLNIDKSGVIRFWINKQKLTRLRVIAPATYSHLKQRTIPLGHAYSRVKVPDTEGYNVIRDEDIDQAMIRRLADFRESNDVLSYKVVRQQLQRRKAKLQLSRGAGVELTPAEIYRQYRDSVVIVGNLYANGKSTQGSGFVLDSSGIVVTAHHVIDKPAAVSRGVMTFTGDVYPITEILAASKSADVAIVKIDANGLKSVPLGTRDDEGSTVTVISHPALKYFSLAQGHISRYWLATLHGEVVLRMDITADIAEGSSGGPVFNSRGEVAGMVSSSRGLRGAMVLRTTVPAFSIRRLIETSATSP